MIGLRPADLAVLRRYTASLATTWSILRQDNAPHKFTSYDMFVSRPNESGGVYSPAPGIVTFTNRREGGLRNRSSQLTGLVDEANSGKAGITFEDLQARRLNDAVITQSTVNPDFPWRRVTVNHWFVQDAEDFNSSEWTLKIAGWTSRLKEKQGKIFTRQCLNELGVNDNFFSLCPVNLNVFPLKVTTQVTGAVAPTKSVFSAAGFTDPRHEEEDYFAFGRVHVLDGQNVSYEENIDASIEISADVQQITLTRPLPFKLTAGDGIEVFAGCSKTPSACKDPRFDAFQGIGGVGGFQGFPDMPGFDAVIRNPTSTP